MTFPNDELDSLLFVHPWEVGARRAKEMLFTGDALSAEEARQLGMVNHVVVQLGHSHNTQVHGMPLDPNGAALIREQSRTTERRRSD